MSSDWGHKRESPYAKRTTFGRRDGGGTNARHSRSRIFANPTVCKSPWSGPTIWTPTGNPARVRPKGATVAGS